MTRLLIGFLLGLWTVLAFRHLPPMFHDLPSVPDDWTPKYRAWHNGVELTVWDVATLNSESAAEVRARGWLREIRD